MELYFNLALLILVLFKELLWIGYFGKQLKMLVKYHSTVNVRAGLFLFVFNYSCVFEFKCASGALPLYVYIMIINYLELTIPILFY